MKKLSLLLFLSLIINILYAQNVRYKAQYCILGEIVNGNVEWGKKLPNSQVIDFTPTKINLTVTNNVESLTIIKRSDYKKTTELESLTIECQSTSGSAIFIKILLNSDDSIFDEIWFISDGWITKYLVE